MLTMFKIVLFPLILGLSYAISQNTAVVNAGETLEIPLEYAPCILWYLESPSRTESIGTQVLMKNETGWSKFEGSHVSRSCFGSCLYKEIHPLNLTEYKLTVTNLDPRPIIFRYTIGECVIRESKLVPIVISLDLLKTIFVENGTRVLGPPLVVIVLGLVIIRLVDPPYRLW